MSGILVRKEVNELYQDLISDYSIGDYQDVIKYNIVMSCGDDDKFVMPVNAMEYLAKYTKEEGDHKVYDVLTNEECIKKGIEFKDYKVGV